jgi:hypothetical protein
MMAELQPGSLLMVCITCAVLFGSVLWTFRRLRASWIGFAVVAVLTLDRCYACVQTYQATSLSSITIIGTKVYFWVTPLAWLVFPRKIVWFQNLVILSGIASGPVIIVMEVKAWSGDCLVLPSVLCYSILTVYQEWLGHTESTVLYIFSLSTVAMPVSGILTGALDSKAIRDFEWNWKTFDYWERLGIGSMDF